jgi:hypothetical protein
MRERHEGADPWRLSENASFSGDRRLRFYFADCLDEWLGTFQICRQLFPGNREIVESVACCNAAGLNCESSTILRVLSALFRVTWQASPPNRGARDAELTQKSWVRGRFHEESPALGCGASKPVRRFLGDRDGSPKYVRERVDGGVTC